MRRTIPATLIFILLLAGAACAQVSIKAEVDKSKLTTEELLTYKLTVTSQLKDVPKPKVPDFAGFHLVSQAHYSNISFGKGKSEIRLVYVYLLKGISAGKFTIGPSSVKIKGETYSTAGFEIEFTQGTGQTPAAPSEEPPLPLKPVIPDSGQPKVTL